MKGSHSIQFRFKTFFFPIPLAFLQFDSLATLSIDGGERQQGEMGERSDDDDDDDDKEEVEVIIGDVTKAIEELKLSTHETEEYTFIDEERIKDGDEVISSKDEVASR